MIIKPQEGPQEQFLSSQADICIYGGAAGGGKTYALLLEPLRHVKNSGFGCVIFRKNANQIFAEGGLWDTSYSIYPHVGGVPKMTPTPTWNFPSGMKVSFGHIDQEKDVLKWQGSQIAMIAFDELTHFTEQQFWYMMSRNRSSSGIAGYIRATCNPDADSWVASFISWWWDENTGYPIPERSGVIRYFIRRDGEIKWASSEKELCEKYGLTTAEDKAQIKSATFVASKLSDNKILMDNDPSYLANLKALTLVDQERLLYGNWKIRPAAGLFFQRSQIPVDGWLDEIPADVSIWVRAWDLAATAESEGGEPAYTAGVLIGKRRSNGRYVIADVTNKRLAADAARQHIKATAIMDKQRKGSSMKIRLPQDPGQAGKAQAADFVKFLTGFNVSIELESGSKETRAEPFAAQWQHGNVEIVKGEWNESYLNQLESFPEGKFKDMVDASSSGFNELTKSNITSLPPITGSLGRQSYWKR